MSGNRLRVRDYSEATIRQMVARDPLSAGSRGSHRYTFGTAPHHFGHAQDWSVLIDPPATLAVLAAIFDSDDFYQSNSASGGDFVLPGCVEYQHLHSDGQINAATGEHAKDIADAPKYGKSNPPLCVMSKLVF